MKWFLVGFMTFVLSLILAVGSINIVIAKTWECNSGVHYGTGIPSGDWVRSCDDENNFLDEDGDNPLHDGDEGETDDDEGDEGDTDDDDDGDRGDNE